MLEGDLKEKRLRSHGDSVFAFKHLGVMYAAQEATREKGKYYMLQLLYVEPTARIMDMYASDMIYMIFRNIQEEFSHDPGRHRPPPADKEARQAAAADREAKQPAGEKGGSGRVGPGPSRTIPAAKGPEPLQPARTGRDVPEAEPKSHRLYWLAGGAVLVGAGVAAYYLTAERPPAKEIYEVR